MYVFAWVVEVRTSWSDDHGLAPPPGVSTLMGDHPGNTSVTVIGLCDFGQVASLHVASVHPAVQVGTWRKLGGKGGNPVGGAQHH